MWTCSKEITLGRRVELIRMENRGKQKKILANGIKDDL